MMTNTQVTAKIPRFSVIFPTYQRRDIIVASVCALAKQEFDGSYEVIVVVDGSTDGTAEALGKLEVPFPLTVVEQVNQGASQARNHGASIAGGEILLFLDDDMEAHPRLLAAHDRSHCEGADVVIGHIPLHPDSPATLLTRGIKEWAERRGRRLSAPQASLALQDLLTGQMSVSRAAFLRVGRFDTDFTRNGTFGNEDLDFGVRLQRLGCRIVYNHAAVSFQKYVVRPTHYLRQYHEAGQADVCFARKHPAQAHAVFEKSKAFLPSVRLVWRPLVALHPLTAPITRTIRWFALRRAERGLQDECTARWFRRAKRIAYLSGVKKAGGIPRPRSLRVLAYHAIADLKGANRLEPYGVPAEEFRRQLETLQRAGYQFVSVEEALHFVSGSGGLPRRPVLLTFDDCYEDLLHTALPVLQELRIPAVAFAVSGHVGGTNEWDQAIGAPSLRLLDGTGLQKLAQAGVEIGAHSRTHRLLKLIPPGEMSSEVEGSVSDLEELRLPRPRLYSYPHGESNEALREVVRNAGLKAAFSVDPDFLRAGQDAFRIPRIEILRGDTGWRFRWKVAVAGPLIDPRRGIRTLPPRLWRRYGRPSLDAFRRFATAASRETVWLAKVFVRWVMTKEAHQRLRSCWMRAAPRHER